MYITLLPLRYLWHLKWTKLLKSLFVDQHGKTILLYKLLLLCASCSVYTKRKSTTNSSTCNTDIIQFTHKEQSPDMQVPFLHSDHILVFKGLETRVDFLLLLGHFLFLLSFKIIYFQGRVLHIFSQP